MKFECLNWLHSGLSFIVLYLSFFRTDEKRLDLPCFLEFAFASNKAEILPPSNATRWDFYSSLISFSKPLGALESGLILKLAAFSLLS